MVKLRHRKIAVFESLHRSRIGMSEQEVARVQHPRRSLLVMAGATGITPQYKNGERESESRSPSPHEERTPDGHGTAA